MLLEINGKEYKAKFVGGTYFANFYCIFIKKGKKLAYNDLMSCKKPDIKWITFDEARKMLSETEFDALKIDFNFASI